MSVFDINDLHPKYEKFLQKFSEFLSDYAKEKIEAVSALESAVTTIKAAGTMHVSKLVYFNSMQLAQALITYLPSGVPMSILERYLTRMSEVGLVHAGMTAGTWHLNVPLLKVFSDYDIVDNALADFHYIFEKYRPAIVEIIVKDQNTGDQFSGTGFFISKTKVLTNAHVIFGDNDSIKIEEISSSFGPLTFGKTIRHERLDLATIECSVESLPFELRFDRADILDEVIAIGFPRVSRSEKNPLLISKGAITGFTDTYDKKGPFAILDCQITPGNSGGPVINRFGLVCGIVTLDFQSKTEHSDYKHPAVIPYQTFQGDILK